MFSHRCLYLYMCILILFRFSFSGWPICAPILFLSNCTYQFLFVSLFKQCWSRREVDYFYIIVILLSQGSYLPNIYILYFCVAVNSILYFAHLLPIIQQRVTIYIFIVTIFYSFKYTLTHIIYIIHTHIYTPPLSTHWSCSQTHPLPLSIAIHIYMHRNYSGRSVSSGGTQSIWVT